MPFTGKKRPGAPTLGVFVPCDPRIDEESRTRAFNIGRRTAALLARRLRLPDGSAPNVFSCSRLVDSESTADAAAREMMDAGVGAILIVPDTWFFPGKTAMALTAHFAPSVPIACVGGNNAPKPGVVGIDALVGAYAQTGRLCPMVIGAMPETGLDPEFDAKTQDEIVDLAYAMLTRVALRGRRFLAVDTDSMQMETALNHVHAARRFFGLESTRESMKLFADMLHKKGGYDPAELKALRDWVVNVKFKGRIFADSEDIKKYGRAILTGKNVKAPALAAADKAKLDEGLALYLIIRNYMRDVNAVGGGWTSQLAWGSDRRGIPLTTADIAESLFNSTEDHTGRKTVVPFATENDIQALLTMIAYCYLSGGKPTLFMDFRKVYEPWEIAANAKALGARPAPVQERALDGARLHRRRQLRLGLARLRREVVPVQGHRVLLPRAGLLGELSLPEGHQGDGRPRRITPISRAFSPWSRTRPSRSSSPRRSPSASATPPTTPGRTRS